MSTEKDLNGESVDAVKPLELALTPIPPQKYVSLSRDDHVIVIHDLAGATFPLAANTASSVDHHDFGIAPPGTLYATIIKQRNQMKWKYGFLTSFYNIALILQILFGAIMTALAGSKIRNQIALTILSAANTVNAGILALMHNSGLPDRLKNDFGEFEKVEQHVRSVIETGVVKDGWTREEVVADCWERYMNARAAIGRNKPSHYQGTGTDKPIIGPGKV